MPDKQPIDIDYARAESADVVRKKFRGRVILFVVGTIVAMLIGIGWLDSPNQPRLLIAGNRQQPTSSVSVWSMQGWVVVHGSLRTTSLNPKWTKEYKVYGNDSIGMVFRYNNIGAPRWTIHIRYRTLFLLAMIPWIITLIRMIRVWRVKHAVQIDR